MYIAKGKKIPNADKMQTISLISSERYRKHELPYTIHKLKTYPQDGNYLELLGLNAPVCITKGEDMFCKHRHLWVVYPNHKTASCNFYDFFWKNLKKKTTKCNDACDQVQMFKTHEKAYEFSMKIYKQWLNEELKNLK